jgi:hypothetical protein
MSRLEENNFLQAEWKKAAGPLKINDFGNNNGRTAQKRNDFGMENLKNERINFNESEHISPNPFCRMKNFDG